MFLELFTETFIDAEKESWYMSQLYIPLSPSILQHQETDVEQAWHVTSISNLKTVKKIQSKRKDLPTFTTGSPGISMGAASGAEIIINLTGKSAFRSPIDFFSRLDRNGRRWLNTNNYYPLEKLFMEPMNKKIQEFMKSIGFKNPNVDIEELINMTLQGKEKAKFIKFYFDESKKLMNKKLMKVLNDTLAEQSKEDFRDFSNDEVLLHQFKINYVMTIIDSGGNHAMNQVDMKRTKDECKRLNLKYDGEMERSDIKDIDV